MLNELTASELPRGKNAKYLAEFSQLMLKHLFIFFIKAFQKKLVDTIHWSTGI